MDPDQRVSRFGMILVSCFSPVTALVTPWLDNFLEAPEIRNYEAGRPVFDHPVTETYAEVIQKQLEEKIQRDGILKRWRASHSAVTVWLTMLAVSRGQRPKPSRYDR